MKHLTLNSVTAAPDWAKHLSPDSLLEASEVSKVFNVTEGTFNGWVKQKVFPNYDSMSKKSVYCLGGIRRVRVRYWRYATVQAVIQNNLELIKKNQAVENHNATTIALKNEIKEEIKTIDIVKQLKALPKLALQEGRKQYSTKELKTRLNTDMSIAQMLESGYILMPSYHAISKKKKYIFYWTEENYLTSIKMYESVFGCRLNLDASDSLDSALIQLRDLATVEKIELPKPQFGSAAYMAVLKKMHQLAATENLTITVSFNLGANSEYCEQNNETV